MMETNLQARSLKKINKNHAKEVTFMNRLKEHGELIAALFSGVLIIITWDEKVYLYYTKWYTHHVIACAGGEITKSKEGIEETIANKELNVEMLMIFAAIGSTAIGFWTEWAIHIFIFALSGALDTYTLNKSN